MGFKVRGGETSGRGESPGHRAPVSQLVKRRNHDKNANSGKRVSLWVGHSGIEEAIMQGRKCRRSDGGVICTGRERGGKK